MSARTIAFAAALCGAGLLGTGCSQAAASPQARVSSWASQSGIVGLDAQVAADVSSLEGALSTGHASTAKDLCSVLNDDVGQAYDELPSPDSQLTNLLDRAYLSLDQGAVDCQSAAGVGHAVAEIDRGNVSLQQADARLRSFGVSTNATGITGGT